ncbi:MAG TPA: metallophosphoesterase [Vicinamibacterales bacterium]|nr:metallophosphoesterase [Vicinamibacterales bacterium]
MTCFFVSDLHGSAARYARLAERIRAEQPEGVFLGGDLLAHGARGAAGDEFLEHELAPLLRQSRSDRTRVFVILGNDDPGTAERAVLAGERRGDWTYLHRRHVRWRGFDVFGYACVPPTPFLLKDWERYDVSRHVDPGCVSPEEGGRTVPVPEHDIRYGTIRADLDALAGGRDLSRALLLLHAPPYQTALDRAALDGKRVDHVQVDVHVGSVAVRRFIEARQPMLALHGHVHESARLTGAWRDRLGRTVLLSAAHDGPELALVRFDPEQPEQATRELL